MRRTGLGVVALAVGCAGGGASTPAAPRDPSAPVGIASGDFHTCALRGDGTVRCWGRNEEGQLGDGTRRTRTAPVAVAGLAEVTRIALGANASCALLRDGTVRCWGAGKAWGDGRQKSNVPPTAVQGLRDVTTLDGGGLLMCAVRSGGRVVCWGDEGDARPPGASAPPAAGAVDVSVAEAHACALDGGGGVSCLGDSPWNGVAGPSLARPRLAGATQVTTGDAMACALLSTGGVSCWGRNDQGELGRAPDNDWHPEPL